MTFTHQIYSWITKIAIAIFAIIKFSPRTDSRSSLEQVLTWLGYSNSAFNPIIYSIFNTEFREAFKRILTKGARARGNQPSTSECGEFRSVVVQKRNGSMIECNISPRSSADSCQVGVMAQRHRDTIVSAI